MAKKGQPADRKVYVTIRGENKKKPVKIESWRYWEIVGELQFIGIDRFEAYDAARWCAILAKPGDSLMLQNGVTLDVKEETLVNG